MYLVKYNSKQEFIQIILTYFLLVVPRIYLFLVIFIYIYYISLVYITFWFICVYSRTRRSYCLWIRAHRWEANKHDCRETSLSVVLIFSLSVKQLEISAEIRVLLCKVGYVCMVRGKIGPQRAYCLHNEWEQNVPQQHCLYIWWLQRTVTDKNWMQSMLKSCLSLSVGCGRNRTLYSSNLCI